MREQVVDILKRARRRLLAARAVHAAAVLTAAAVMASAALEVAWAMSGLPYNPGLAVCSLPMIAGLLLLLMPLKVRLPGLQTPLARLAGATLTAIGLLGVVAFATPIHSQIARVTIPAVLLPAAALTALMFVYLRPLPLREVAVMLDLQLRLRERLSTAIELIERGRGAGAGLRCMCRGRPALACRGHLARVRSGFLRRRQDACDTRGQDGLDTFGAGLSEVIFSQAVDQAQKAGVERARFAVAGRGTIGALGLSVLLALILLALPGGDREQSFVTGSAEITNAFPTMSPQQKTTLAAELARAARSAPSDQARRDLNAVKEAVLKDDPQALRDALARLEDAIHSGKVRLVKVAGVGPVEGHVTDVTNGAAAAATGPHGGDEANVATRPGAGESPMAMSLVYNPRYVSFVDKQASPDSGQTQGGGFVSYDRVWEQAVSRANQSLRDGQVPPRCQQLVRDFFARE